MKFSQILIGGCSSVGKSTIAKSLASTLGLKHCELDQLRKSSGAATFRQLDSIEIWDRDTEHLVNIIKQMSDASKGIVRQWYESNESGILEGEGIEPSTVNTIDNIENAGIVYIIETDEEKLHQTLFNRSKRYRDLTSKRQQQVVAMNVQYSEFIRSEAESIEQPWVWSQPWATLQERILELLHDDP